MDVVSTDHSHANNLASLIICFFKQQIFFSFVNTKTITIFGDLFLSVKFTFLFH